MKLACLILVTALVSFLHGAEAEVEPQHSKKPGDREERAACCASAHVVVPTMANSPGRFGAYFKTRVVIYNPTELSYSIYATLYGPNGEVDTQILRMSPKIYSVWDNFLEQVFGYNGAGAVIFDSWFDPPGGSSDFDFIVRAEVYTDSPNGRYSTLVTDGQGSDSVNLKPSAVHPADVIAGVTSNADQRINVGVFNRSSRDTTIRVAVGDGNGNTVEEISLVAPGSSWVQKPVSARVEDGFVQFSCTDCSLVYPWVVTVDNRSNDGVLIQPTTYVPLRD